MCVYKVYVEETTTYEFTLKAQDAADAIWNTEERFERDDFDPDEMCTNIITSRGDNSIGIKYSAVKVSD